MKIRNLLKYFFSLIIVIILYFAFISNIDYFITIKEDSIEKHKNTYNTIENSTNKVSMILNYSEYDYVNDKNMKVMFKSDFILNLISRLYNFSLDETKDFLQDLTSMEAIKVLNSEVYEGDIFYGTIEEIDDYSSEIVSSFMFTDDFKNFYYQSYLPIEKNAYEEDGDKTVIDDENVNIEMVSQNVRGHIKNLGIEDEYGFEITTIKSGYRDYGMQRGIYKIEDTKHNIEIEYNWNTDSIIMLRIGF